MRPVPVTDDPAFATLLPHGPLLTDDVVLLSTPRPRRAGLALGLVWEVTPVNLEACSEARCSRIARTLEGVLLSLPEGGALQVLMQVRPAQHVPAWEALRQDLDDIAWQQQVQAVRQGLGHRDGLSVGRLRTVTTLLTVRLPVTTLPPTLAQRLRTLLTFTEYASQRLQEAFQACLQEALAESQRRSAAIVDALAAAGIAVRRLAGQALCAALQTALAPEAQAAGFVTPGAPLRSVLLTQPATPVSGGWHLGEWATRVLSMRTAPAQTAPGLLSAPRAPAEAAPLALWDAWPALPWTLVVNVTRPPRQAELERLKYKRTLAFFQARTVLGDTSPEHGALKDELDTLLRQSFTEGLQLLWARVHVVLWGPAEQLRVGEEAVIQAGRRLGLEWLPEPVLGSTLFLHTLPLGFDPAWPEERFLRRARRLPVANLAQLLPLYGGVRGTATPTVLYLNRRGESVSFDPFDSPTAPHMVVLGTSGAGKSFATAHLLHQVLPLGATVVILDRWASYAELCAAWGGHYLTIQYDQPVCFNPFHGPLDRGHRAFLVALLAEMASGGDARGGVSRSERATLGEALVAFVRERQSVQEPTLGEFAAFLRDCDPSEGMGRYLARLLAPYYGDGAYAGFFDGPTTLTLERAMTVVELSQLRHAPDLQAALMLVLLHSVTQRFADPARINQRKFLVSDEAWALLKHDTSAQVLEEVARTFRKLGTCAVFVSQQVSDFATPAGKAIRDNAGTLLLLQQNPDEVERMRALFDLTDQEVALLKTVRRRPGWSDAYLRLPQQEGGLVRLVPDAFFRCLVSQVPAERERRTALLAAYGGDVRRAVAELVQTAAEEG